MLLSPIDRNCQIAPGIRRISSGLSGPILQEFSLSFRYFLSLRSSSLSLSSPFSTFNFSRGFYSRVEHEQFHDTERDRFRRSLCDSKPEATRVAITSVLPWAVRRRKFAREKMEFGSIKLFGQGRYFSGRTSLFERICFWFFCRSVLVWDERRHVFREICGNGITCAWFHAD